MVHLQENLFEVQVLHFNRRRPLPGDLHGQLRREAADTQVGLFDSHETLDRALHLKRDFQTPDGNHVHERRIPDT
jgi:hypothetical protein